MIDSPQDLEQKWPGILAGKPDFIKTYLLYGEEYDRRKGRLEFKDWLGPWLQAHDV